MNSAKESARIAEENLYWQERDKLIAGFKELPEISQNIIRKMVEAIKEMIFTQTDKGLKEGVFNTMPYIESPSGVIWTRLFITLKGYKVSHGGLDKDGYWLICWGENRK